MKNLNLLIIFYSFFSWSCNESRSETHQNITDSVSCSAFPEQYYAIYLPSDIKKDTKLPAFFLFDPGALAKSTVIKYQAMAEKYKIVLACSYSIKNGPIETNSIAADAMITDALQKFPIDQKSLFYAGFSGGSRFAWYYASVKRPVKGVIGCGAFFPSGNSGITAPTFTYSEIAGNSDFNFTEGVIMANQLSEHNIPFQYISFQGEHAWPPDSIFERALVWQLAHLRHLSKLKQLSYALEFEALKKSHEENNLVQSAWILRNLCILDENMCNNFREHLQGEEYQKHFSTFQKSLQFEDSLKSSISEAVNSIIESSNCNAQNSITINWWQSLIQSMNTLENNGNDVYIKNAAGRVKAQIGILVWELNRNMMRTQNYARALEAAEILTYTYPENNTYCALKAESQYLLGDTLTAVENYKRAVNLGFDFNNPFLGSSIIIGEIAILAP